MKMFTGVVSERPETLLLSAVIVKASLGACWKGSQALSPRELAESPCLGGIKKTCRYSLSHKVSGGRGSAGLMDMMLLKVFSNLGDSVIYPTSMSQLQTDLELEKDQALGKSCKISINPMLTEIINLIQSSYVFSSIFTVSALYPTLVYI